MLQREGHDSQRSHLEFSAMTSDNNILNVPLSVISRNCASPVMNDSVVPPEGAVIGGSN